MQYLVNETQIGSENTITMEHYGKKLTWSINTYRRLNVGPDLIRDINQYWARLPIEEQDEIWRIYSEIYEAFETIENTRNLDKTLFQLIAELFKYHPMQKIMEYYYRYARIKTPTDLKDNYVEGLEKDLTYLRSQYDELVGLMIVLKIIIPIWGTYVGIVGAEVSSNMKEYRAASLLKATDVVNFSSYNRLLTYIRTYWGGHTKPHSSAAIVAGLSSDEVPNYLLGNALFRHIATAQLISQDSPIDPPNMIAAIYNFIIKIIDNMDKSFGGRINEKSLDKAQGDDDNTSVVENYKIKQEISEGVIVTHEVHLTKHYLDILERIDPTADKAGFEAFNTLCRDTLLEGFAPTPLSRAICMWVLDPIVTAKILDYVDYESLRTAHALTYWLLQHWGYHSIALLIFATPLNTNAINNVVRQQATEQQLDKLNEIYPYAQNVTAKRKPSKRDSNVALAAIRHVVSGFYSTWWEIPKWEDPERYNGINNIRISNRRMGLPYDIEPVLAELIIQLKTVHHKGKYGLSYLNQKQQ